LSRDRRKWSCRGEKRNVEIGARKKRKTRGGEKNKNLLGGKERDFLMKKREEKLSRTFVMATEKEEKKKLTTPREVWSTGGKGNISSNIRKKRKTSSRMVEGKQQDEGGNYRCCAKRGKPSSS